MATDTTRASSNANPLYLEFNYLRGVMLGGAAWCCVVLRGAAWCCVVLRGAAWCCVVLCGVAWCIV